jgi:hypothetical protein
VQAGEVSPPQAMLDELAAHRELFSRVEGLLEIRDDAALATLWRSAREPEVIAAAQSAISRMRQAALDVGADYLLFIGGTVDHGTSATPLCVFDITIVGAFLVPSRAIHAVGKVSASLIDARTGRVVSIIGADAQRNGLAPSIMVDGAEEHVVEGVRGDLMKELTKRFVAELATDKTVAKG